MDWIFSTREAAGRALARVLADMDELDTPVVLALPRGGVVVGWEIAQALGAPLDILMVRKIGVPGQEEFAMGAIAAGGVKVMNPEVSRVDGASARAVSEILSHELGEMERRERLYRRERPPVDLTGRTVIVVDDGLATGATMRAAIQALRELGPTRVILAVPVAPAETCERLREAADLAVCLAHPEPFRAVSQWYESFPEVSDAQVSEIMDRATVAAASG